MGPGGTVQVPVVGICVRVSSLSKQASRPPELKSGGYRPKSLCRAADGSHRFPGAQRAPAGPRPHLADIPCRKSVYSFHNFARRAGSVSCSAALRRRRATMSLSLPAEIFCAMAPLPPVPEANRLDLRTKVERAVPAGVLLAIDDCDAADDAVAVA